MRRTLSIMTAAVLLTTCTPGVALAQLQRAGAWAFGPSYAVDHDPVRDLVFLGSGGVVRIVDVSNPADPQLQADIHTHGFVEEAFYDAATQRLFLACGEGGMELWNVATPTAPALLSRSEIFYFGVDCPVMNVEVLGDIAIVDCNWGYVHTVDVSDPAAPAQVAFNGVMGNPALDMSIGTGGQVHTTGAQYYVRLDVDSTGSIDVTGQKDFDFGSGPVFGTPEVAYVGYGGSMYILDLLLAGFPAWSVTNVGGMTEIDVHDQKAYIVNQGGFRIYDVATHNSPFLQSVVDADRQYRDLVVNPPYASIAALDEGLVMLDVSDPAAPSPAAAFTDVYSGVTSTEVRSDLAYIASLYDGLVIVDTANLESVEISRVDTPGAANDVALEGDLAFVADHSGGLRLIDISVPTAPAEIGFLDGFDAWRVEAAADVAYVIEAIPNEPYNLHTIDVSTPSAPTDVSVLPLPDAAWEFARSGDRLWVAADAGGVILYDISVPTAPVQLTSYAIPDVTGIDLVGDVLYVASFQVGGVNGGLYTVDVSDPMMPVQLAHLYDPGFLPLRIGAEGEFAYAATGRELHVYDVSDPANPVELEEVPTPWDVFDITSVRGTLYLSIGHGGMLALDNPAWVDPSLIFTDGFESGDTTAWSAGG